ncbi:MAG TPA: GNAT family N-acetyltransferase [Acidimicrobiales bacterium]
MTRRALPHGYELDDDPGRVDVDEVTRFVAEDSYWATGRTREVMAELVAGAERVVGLYAPDGSQAGFCRVVSDVHTIAYLADVYVHPDHRGDGRGVELVREAVDNGPFAHLRWILLTRDAHGLYRKLGFEEPNDWMLTRPRPSP